MEIECVVCGGNLSTCAHDWTITIGKITEIVKGQAAQIAALQAAIMPTIGPRINLANCQKCGEFRGHGHECKPIADTTEAKAGTPVVCMCGHSTTRHNDRGDCMGYVSVGVPCSCKGLGLPVQPSEQAAQAATLNAHRSFGSRAKFETNAEPLMSAYDVLEAERDALKAELDQLKAKPAWCYYCKLTLPDDAAVKAHRCPQHPLVHEIAKLKAELDTPIEYKLDDTHGFKWSRRGNTAASHGAFMVQEIKALKAELAALKSATPGAEGKRLLEMLEAQGAASDIKYETHRKLCVDFGINYDGYLAITSWQNTLIAQAKLAASEHQDLHIQALLKNPHVIAKIAELFAAMNARGAV